mmetsp:Transcript_73774/g.186531  ORF Transcript_73774/g.186531 Transcript_73774/m.186531 type:complete len:118 (+) Transcript_73774:4350-4703(+)
MRTSCRETSVAESTPHVLALCPMMSGLQSPVLEPCRAAMGRCRDRKIQILGRSILSAHRPGWTEILLWMSMTCKQVHAEATPDAKTTEPMIERSVVVAYFSNLNTRADRQVVQVSLH